MDYVDFKYSHQILLEQDTDEGKWKQRLLIARSKTGVVSDDLNIKIEPLDEPHLGHESFLAPLWVRSRDGVAGEGVAFEPLLLPTPWRSPTLPTRLSSSGAPPRCAGSDTTPFRSR